MTYEDWLRCLTVLHVVAYGTSADIARRDVGSPDRADDPERADIETLMQRSPMAREVARALGIDRAKPLLWVRQVQHRESRIRYVAAEGTVRPGALRGLCEQGTDGCWSAHAWHEGEWKDLFKVTGHPTAFSAQEHLERLLGRDKATSES